MKHPLLSLGTAVGAFLIAGTAFACSCIISTPAQYYERAEVVFTGTVKAVAQPMFSGYITYSIEVDQSYKGSNSGTVSIVSHESSATCGFTFQKDKRYVVFAFRSENGLETNLCSGTAEVEAATEIMAYLKNNSSGSSSSVRSSSSSSSSKISNECKPYVCMDGTTHPSCTADGHVINYFAPPCLTHGGEVTSDRPFTDIRESHPLFEAIVYVKTHGIVQGYPDGTFRPSMTINRAEFVKMLVEASYSDNEIHECLQNRRTLPWDVPRSEWFASYVCVAMEHGVVGGYPDGSFRPGISINAAEAAKIVVLTMGLDAEAHTSGEWYVPYINALKAYEALPVSLQAGSTVSRGNMAEILWNLRVTIEPRLQ